MCPHPGHMFGGQVTASAVAHVKGLQYKRVVLLGPVHRPIPGSRIGDFMVGIEQAFATPLGTIPVDTDFINALARLVPLTRVQHDNEHSLEIGLPFLQLALDSFNLVPIMLGLDMRSADTPAQLEALATALAQLSDEDTLFVASTDLSHLDHYAEVVRIDQHLVNLVNAYDIEGLSRALAQEEVYACGATGLVTVMRAAQLRGATTVRVMVHINSGDILRDRRPGTYTVGYMGAVVY